MYNISEAYRKAINKPGRAFKSRIVVDNKVIDDTNISNFNVTDAIVAGDDFEIGTAIMSSTSIELIKDIDINDIPMYGRNLLKDSAKERATTRFLEIKTYDILADHIGKTISVSFDLKAEINREILVYPYQNNGISITGTRRFLAPIDKFQRFSFIDVVKDWGINNTLWTKGGIGFYDYTGVNNYIIKNIKIELGDIQVPEWSPAPEDLTQINNIQFENKEIKLDIGIELEDKSFEYVPMGLYTIEKAISNSNTITLKGIDRMYKFEKDYVTNLTFPTTLLKIAQEICQKAGVELVNTSFPNSDYTIDYKPVLENVTLRKAIAQVSELAGGYARITRDGKLEIFNLKIGTGSQVLKYASMNSFIGDEFPIISDVIDESKVKLATINKDNYINLANKEFELAKINKVIVKLGAEEAIMGSGSNPYYIVDNMFCQNPTKVINGLYDILNGVAYLPFNSKWQGDMSLDCGDTIWLYLSDDNVLQTIFTNRTLTYSGGIREEIQSVGKSDIEKQSTSKGSMTLDMEKAFTEIKVLDGEISQRVKTDDFESYVEQTAGELTSKVSRGDDLETEVKQNAESWELSIKGKLKGTKYKFDGDSFTIGGTSGDNVTHTPSMSKYIHSDGSYTQISSAGLERFVAGRAKKYHYLFHAGEVTMYMEKATIQLPDDFKGKNFYVSFFIKQLDGGVAISNRTAMNKFGINFYNDSSSIDYANARVNVAAYAVFVEDQDWFKYGDVTLGYIVTA